MDNHQWISSEDELPPTDTRLHIKGYFGLKMRNEELDPSIGSWGRVEGEPYDYLQWQIEGHDTPYWAGYLTVTHWAYAEVTMNRETILSASNSKLDVLCATKIIGWKVSKGFEVKVYRDKNDYVHSYHAYSPSTNIAQAIALLTHLRDTWGMVNFDWAIRTCYNRNVFQVQMIRCETLPHFQFVSEHESLPRAIVIASLLAVAEMEAQP